MSHSKMDNALMKKLYEITLQRLAWPGVILPASYTLQRRQPSRNIAWMFPSIRTNFSWFICREASGAPNCFLSSRYLANPVCTQLKEAKKLYSSCHSQSITCTLPKISFSSETINPNLKYRVPHYPQNNLHIPVADVIHSHSNANWLPCHHDSGYCQYLQRDKHPLKCI